jgi:hypothetical protein|tara:strand:- start:276 stop:479 length:204 start_codon:yes stop_codon:yes gene_type:complete
MVMEELYRKIEQLTINEDPLLIAGIMMAQALTIYKSMLTEEEFNRLAEHILNTTDAINVEGPGPVIH